MTSKRREKYQNLKNSLSLSMQDEVNSLETLQKLYEKQMGHLDSSIAQKIEKVHSAYFRKIERLNSMHQKYENLMSKSDLEIRLGLCNERVDISHLPKNAEDRSLTELDYMGTIFPRGSSEKGADLSVLGIKYIDLISEKYPGDILLDDEGKYSDRRSPEQIELAKELVSASLPLIYKIAISITDKGWAILKDRRLHLSKDNKLTTDELVSEGVISAIRSFHNYNPQIVAMTTHIALNVAAGMYRAGRQSMGLLQLPVHIADEAIKIVTKSKGRYDGIRKISHSMEMIVPEEMGTLKTKVGVQRVPSVIATTIYSGVKSGRVNIDDRLNDSEGLSRQDKWADRFLTDETTKSPEELVLDKELLKILENVLLTLTPREEKVLRQRFGVGEKCERTLDEVSEDFDVPRERIRQIEAKALMKMRHPDRIRLLSKMFF
jgi:RNA polymerase sigma factor (sigma-70 family)